MNETGESTNQFSDKDKVSAIAKALADNGGLAQLARASRRYSREGHRFDSEGRRKEAEQKGP